MRKLINENVIECFEIATAKLSLVQAYLEQCSINDNKVPLAWEAATVMLDALHELDGMKDYIPDCKMRRGEYFRKT